MNDSSCDFDRLLDRSGTGSIKWGSVAGGQLAMGLADMDFAAAPPILEALAARVEHGVFGYTEAGQSFYSAIVNWVFERRGWVIEPEWITPAPGIMPSMAHLMRSTLEPGSGVIVQTPAFSPIPHVIADNNFVVVENSLQLVDNRYEMDLEALETAAARPDVHAMVLCSPHNPSGRVWSREELEAVAELCETHNVLVISDEIHGEVIFPGRSFTPYGMVAHPTARHATLFGPSKGFNLPGLRTAVTVIPDESLRSEFRRELTRVNEDFGINPMGALALEAAYTLGADWLDALTTYLQGNMDELTEGLAATTAAVTVIPPDASFLVWLDCRALGLTDEELKHRFDQAGVLIEPGINFGHDGSGFVRINVGTTRARVTEAVERVSKSLAM
ncbi:MAG: pyridoxal phosphate-dependent aminotransferase [Acidimicrobiales bacterium]|nr:pyridoxal phosphate-dependent aminotransferase [Acidimicrobiales bacterium]